METLKVCELVTYHIGSPPSPFAIYVVDIETRVSCDAFPSPGCLVSSVSPLFQPYESIAGTRSPSTVL